MAFGIHLPSSVFLLSCWKCGTEPGLWTRHGYMGAGVLRPAPFLLLLSSAWSQPPAINACTESRICLLKPPGPRFPQIAGILKRSRHVKYRAGIQGHSQVHLPHLSLSHAPGLHTHHWGRPLRSGVSLPSSEILLTTLLWVLDYGGSSPSSPGHASHHQLQVKPSSKLQSPCL